MARLIKVAEANEPQSEILNRQGAKNAKTEMADWGEGTELLNAP